MVNAARFLPELGIWRVQQGLDFFGKPVLYATKGIVFSKADLIGNTIIQKLWNRDFLRVL